MAALITPKKAEDYFCYNDNDPNSEYHTIMIFHAHLVIWDTSDDRQFIREMFVEDGHIEKAITQINEICKTEYIEEKWQYWVIAIEQTGHDISRIY